ncbi:sigma-70 family RNA polymerase sigma factor [Tautonia sociabilis]|uniref:sigma-70 family RNA polymerase sigma factor n=1 Tax=Tautonia sociabilis TaxID=2080755 RepID=UPI0013151DDE|nr:sigma-70 family RNA polymerase sigma factor [Tautonia sociabilis]
MGRDLRAIFNAGVVREMADGELLERFLTREGEAAELAFAALVERHGPMVLRVCRSVLRDDHEASDAFQATFLVLVRKAGSMWVADSIGPWLHQVALRVARGARSAKARRRRIEARAAVLETAGPSEPAGPDDLEALIHEELNRLHERYRSPVVLCCLEGLTLDQAARRLGWPMGTVQSRLARGRQRLRERLSRRGVSPSAGTFAAAIASERARDAVPAALSEATIQAATQVAALGATVAGVVPASVARLAKGAMRSMFITKLTKISAGVLAAGVIATGVGFLSASERPNQEPRAEGTEPASAAAKMTDEHRVAQATSMNNLQRIALAMHIYAQEHGGRLPPAAIHKDGTPLLSWRVALLPFIGEERLFEQFNLDEPWDSPSNLALASQMPEVYAPVAGQGETRASTYVQVLVGPGTLFEGEAGRKLDDIPDGPALTLLVVEAAEPVLWTKPEDILYDPDRPREGLGGQFEGGTNVAFADGAVRFLSNEVRPEVLRALSSRDGGEIVGSDALQP